MYEHMRLYRKIDNVINVRLQLISKKKPWYHGGHVAGFVTKYEGLTLLTFRGTGHMVVEWRAPQIQYAIFRFMRNGFFLLRIFTNF